MMPLNTPPESDSPSPAAPPDTWLRAKQLFGDVVTLPLDERAAALDARCGGDTQLRSFVESLLRADEALPTGHSQAAQAGLGAVLDRAARRAWPRIEPGRRFGAFAVIEEIGRGGMGIVYLAERHDGTVAQRVALKLVPPDTLHGDASHQLARERRLLAALEHPHIARLIDAGEDAEGIPYFAMEYVQGAPVTAYCDRLALPLAERLRLFRQICAAVQYAHANLIVHCDIKANNVLVSDGGLPKLLDFGIATTLDAARAEGESGEQRFFSPQTAAPEQFLGQPNSVATDVYALGVLLCELCAGQRPFANTEDRAELRRRVLEEEPVLPSRSATEASARSRGALSLPALRRRLSGDIDAIVARALAKSPRERYASVAQLDADIAAHLEKRPVQARSGERGYRFARYLQRNALAVTFAAAVSIFVLVLAGMLASFATSTAKQNQQLAHERDQAHQREQQAQFERARAQQVTDFLIGLFKDATPRQARKPDISARELLAQGGEKLRGSLSDQPQLKAAMLSAISEAHLALDEVDKATIAAREALALRGTLRPVVARELIDSLAQLGKLANRHGDFAESLAMVDQAQALARVFPEQVDTVALIEIRALALEGLHMPNEAVVIQREVLVLELRAHGAGSPRVMRAATQLAGTLLVVGQVAEAEQLALAHLPRDPGKAAADDPEHGELLLTVAKFARQKSDYKKAYAYSAEAVAIFRKVYGDHAARTASALGAAAIAAQGDGDYLQSLAMFEESLKIQRDLDPDSAVMTISEYNVGALLFYRLHRPQEAIAYFRRAVALGEKRYPPGHGNLANFRLGLGAALRDLRRYADAEATLLQALRAFEAINAPRGVNVAVTRGELACMALERGRGRQHSAVVAASLVVLDRHAQSDAQAQRIRDCAARWKIAAAAKD